VEKEDFGAGTSSRSSRMIHGGLRYLEYLHFGLVREASRERKVLLRVAPGMVRRTPFLILLVKWDQKRRPSHEPRGDSQQDPSLAAGLPHQSEMHVFEVSQSAMDHPRGPRGGPGREILLLD